MFRSNAPPRRARRLISPAARRSARRGGRAPAWSFASARATSTSCVFEARSSHQPSAVLTRTPSVASTLAPSAESRSRTSSTIANLRLSSTWKRSSGVADRLRHRVHDLGQALAARAHRLDQPDRRVERVVEAVPAVLEEDVAAHLAGERRAGLLHLRLDQGVAGLPHQRLAAELGDAVEQRLARLHVGDDRRAGQLLEHRLGEDHQHLVAPDHAALAVDRADAVAVAVEGDAEVELLVGDERASGPRGSPRPSDPGWWLGKRPSTSVKST